MSKKFFSTKSIATLGVLLALEIILQIIGNYVAIGPVSINLSLIPITIAAILVGPIGGAFIGFCNGAIVLLSPSTQALFMPYSLGGTIVTCLIKTSLAGFLAGLIFKPFKNKHEVVGMVLCSLLVPFINTACFCGFAFIFFQDLLKSFISETYPDMYAVMIFVFVGWNFVFEEAVSLLLSPATCKTVKIIEKKQMENQ